MLKQYVLDGRSCTILTERKVSNKESMPFTRDDSFRAFIAIRGRRLNSSSTVVYYGCLAIDSGGRVRGRFLLNQSGNGKQKCACGSGSYTHETPANTSHGE